MAAGPGPWCNGDNFNNFRAGMAEDCDEYRFVESGEVCHEITSEYGVTLAQFLKCSRLWAEY